LATAAIVGGYVALVAIWGWPGLVAAAVHIAVLVLAVPRR
jgi:hypothetical protein